MPDQKTTAQRLDDIEAKLDGLTKRVDNLLALADKAAVFLDSPVTKYLASRKKLLGKLPADGPAA